MNKRLLGKEYWKQKFGWNYLPDDRELGLLNTAREMTLKELGKLIEHCDEIRELDENETLIYYGVKPKMVEALEKGKLPEK